MERTQAARTRRGVAVVVRAHGRPRLGLLGLLVAVVGGLLALPGVASAADFNGDGRAALAVGAPGG